MFEMVPRPLPDAGREPQSPTLQAEIADRCPNVIQPVQYSNSKGWQRRQRTALALKNKRRERKTRGHKRPNHLRTLGFSCYSEYLESDLWKSIRDRQLASYPDCLRCHEPANQVHHSRYTIENLSGASTKHLWSVCGPCHRLAEFDRLGNKATLDRANRFLGIDPPKESAKARKARKARKRANKKHRARYHGAPRSGATREPIAPRDYRMPVRLTTHGDTPAADQPAGR